MYGSVRGVPGNWYPYRDRRQSSETTNMSVSDRLRSILEIFSGDGLWVLETPWFESESQLVSQALVCLGHVVSHPTLGPLG